jgi:hypothetical protein
MESDQFQCKECNSNFDSRSRLKDHWKKKHQQIFIINYCNAINTIFNILTVASSVTINLEECQSGKFNCSQCENFECNHPMKLQKHVHACNSKLKSELTTPLTQSMDSHIQTSIKQYRPVHSDYITDGRLKELQLYIHRELEFVYCSVCEVGILWETLHNHMQRSHGHSIIVAQLLESFQKLINSTRKPINHVNDERIIAHYNNVMVPVNGIEVKSGFKCLKYDCKYCCGTKGTLKSHYQKQHSTQDKIFESCFVQSLFNYPILYFQVSQSNLLTIFT